MQGPGKDAERMSPTGVVRRGRQPDTSIIVPERVNSKSLEYSSGWDRELLLILLLFLLLVIILFYFS